MTKYEFKAELEELIRSFINDDNNRYPTYHIDLDYNIAEEYGELVFRSNKRDVLLKIKKL